MSSRFDATIAEYNKALASKSTDNIELEAKIQDLDSKTFVASLKALPRDLIPISIECTLNNLTNRNDSNGAYTYIETKVYDNNKLVSSHFSTKHRFGTRFISKDQLMKYVVSVSSERTISEEKDWNSFGTFVRAKLRGSFLSANGGWRYDYTLSITKPRYDLANGVISDIRNKLFVGVTCNDLSHDKIISILSSRSTLPEVACELEVERLSQEAMQSRDELDDALAVVWKTLGSEGDSDERVGLIREVYESISKNTSQTRLTLKNILNSAKSLTKSEYYATIYPPLGWYVTDKADGERAVLLARGTDCWVISKDVIHVTIPVIPGKMIADCELITLQGGGRLLGIFDVMAFGSEAIVTSGIEERIGKAADIVKATKMALSSVGIDVFVKEYAQISQPIEEAVLTINNRRRAYKTDGLILTSQGSPYYNTRNLKWKPTHENTVDFMAIRLPKTLEGLVVGGDESSQTYALLVGMNEHRRRILGVRQWQGYEADTGISLSAGYQPVLFKSSLYPLTYVYRAPEGTPDLHGRVVEMAVDDAAATTLRSAFETGKVTKDMDIWRFVRIREDRSPAAGEFGNDADVAESVFSNIIDPFLIEDLYTSTGGGYFEKSRDEIYKASNKFKRYVIHETFAKNISEGDVVLDLAAGRGADLPTYHELGVGRLIAVDIDATAIVELIRRSMEKHITSFRRSKKPMTINALVSNVGGNSNVNQRAIIDRFGVEAVNVIVCNFALHYMCGNATQCTNFFALARDFAIGTPNKESKMVVTVMNGQKIFDLLADYKKGEMWESGEDQKYAIRKDHDDDSLKRFGQMIAVKLPMATKMYSEPLANIAAISEIAESTGWMIESSKPFTEYLSAFKAKGTLELSQDDVKYCSLHEVIVFKYRTDVKKTGSGWYQKR